MQEHFIVIAIMVSLITLIHKVDGKDSTNRGNCWTRTLKTLTPHGLNIEDCVWPNAVYTTYYKI